MFATAFLVLLASTEYACEAASTPQRRQSDTPVPLWGACNFPSQGVNGPLPCADGAECICKDDTYAQCRTQLDGSWTPPNVSWQCQKPGDTPSGSTNPPASSGGSTGGGSTSGGTSGGSSTGGNSPGDSTPESGTTGGDTTAGGDTAGGTSDSSNTSAQPSTSSSAAGVSDSTENRLAGGQQNIQKLRISDGGGPRQGNPAVNQALNAPAASSSDISTQSTDGGDKPASGGGAPAAGGSSSAQVGGCGSTSAPSGWDGVASTSYYGWMGSACNCGQQSWQWTTGSGVYNGAVNQKLFDGKLNSAGAPNCGSSCGQCYELSTSGFNAYNDGVGSGSTMTLQIVDACYGAGDHWCGSTSDDYKDSSDCGVHFDIQTGGPGTGGGSPVGSDGKTWNGGGQIVYYRQTACPQTLSSGYQSSCQCN